MSRFRLTPEPRHLPPWLILDVSHGEPKTRQPVLNTQQSKSPTRERRRPRTMMKTHIVTFGPDDNIVLYEDGNSYLHCPVCGRRYGIPNWAPYSLDGCPDHSICECGMEYGYDDCQGASGAPYERVSENIVWFRSRSLAGESPAHQKEVPLKEKIAQLKNIGIELPEIGNQINEK